MVPESRKLMDLQPDLFSIAEDLDLGPLRVGVFKHGRTRLHPSSSVNVFGTSLEHRLAAVGNISDDP